MVLTERSCWRLPARKALRLAMQIGNHFDVGFFSTTPAWDQEPWTNYDASHQIKAAPSGDEQTSFEAGNGDVPCRNKL